ncbi:hypothetical protein QBC38DRAFT_543980 [Podospora fimiseda]|uniref:Heterokaryon incompatibility domain-containing protein n=1 Tax=Podospora fimiseda TaxID=252190 RepID=A0AAN7BSK8_9PEZI|nr:hypothetical protein QBC38DRAFT_543980 [Podospora fimiseda]
MYLLGGTRNRLALNSMGVYLGLEDFEHVTITPISYSGLHGEKLLSLKLGTPSPKVGSLVEVRLVPRSVLTQLPGGAEYVDFEMVKGWINECCNAESHEACKPMKGLSEQIQGLRVIDCDTREVITAKAGCKFVVLSYVWGIRRATSQSPWSTGGTISVPDDAPETINDAIKSNADEKYQQIMVMDIIYNLAYITIIAAHGDDAYSGLPGVGVERLKPPHLTTSDNTWVPSIMNIREAVEQSKWASRGWTYQEGAFSRRRLIFTSEQVLFECNTIQRSELYPLEESVKVKEEMGNQLIFSGGVFNQVWAQAAQLWMHIDGYFIRDLTYSSDILKTLSGVFRALSHSSSSPTHQIFGIPIVTSLYYQRDERGEIESKVLADGSTWGLDYVFAGALLWRLEYPAWSESNDRNGRGWLRIDGSPSWSWADWQGGGAPNRERKICFNGDDEPTAKFWLQRIHDGEFVRLTEGAVSLINRYDGQPNLFTHRLRVEALVCKVRIERVSALSIVHLRAHGQKWEAKILPNFEKDERFDIFKLGGFICGVGGGRGWFSFVVFFPNDEEWNMVLILWNSGEIGKPAERVGSIDSDCRRVCKTTMEEEKDLGTFKQDRRNHPWRYMDFRSGVMELA